MLQIADFHLPARYSQYFPHVSERQDPWRRSISRRSIMPPIQIWGSPKTRRLLKFGSLLFINQNILSLFALYRRSILTGFQWMMTFACIDQGYCMFSYRPDQHGANGRVLTNQTPVNGRAKSLINTNKVQAYLILFRLQAEHCTVGRLGETSFAGGHMIIKFLKTTVYLPR